MVKLEPGTPAPKPAARKKARITKKNLPEAFQEGAIWGSYVTPTIIKWAGTVPKIFKIPVNDLATVLEVVCRYYYEDNSIIIDKKHPAVAHVCAQIIILLILTISIDSATNN